MSGFASFLKLKVTVHLESDNVIEGVNTIYLIC